MVWARTVFFSGIAAIPKHIRLARSLLRDLCNIMFWTLLALRNEALQVIMQYVLHIYRSVIAHAICCKRAQVHTVGWAESQVLAT